MAPVGSLKAEEIVDEQISRRFSNYSFNGQHGFCKIGRWSYWKLGLFCMASEQYLWNQISGESSATYEKVPYGCADRDIKPNSQQINAFYGPASNVVPDNEVRQNRATIQYFSLDYEEQDQSEQLNVACVEDLYEEPINETTNFITQNAAFNIEERYMNRHYEEPDNQDDTAQDVPATYKKTWAHIHWNIILALLVVATAAAIIGPAVTILVLKQSWAQWKHQPTNIIETVTIGKDYSI